MGGQYGAVPPGGQSPGGQPQQAATQPAQQQYRQPVAQYPQPAQAGASGGGSTGRSCGLIAVVAVASSVLTALMVAMIFAFVIPSMSADSSESFDHFAVRAAEIAGPSVVLIETGWDIRDFETGEQTAYTGFFGSGCIISPDGYIVTNNHVVTEDDEIRPLDSIRVSHGGEWYDARIVGRDIVSDLAVIKIDAAGLPAIEYGSSETLEVGEPVVAIGNPKGLGWSISSGIISAVARNQSRPSGTEEDVIWYPLALQTDAAINGGNSGGALCDADGKLIGINSMGYGGGTDAGLNFAIPIDYARGIIDKLIRDGEVRHAYMGVLAGDVTLEMATVNELPVEQGAVIEEVFADSPAEAAGLEQYDIITALDGEPVRSVLDFYGLLGTHRPGKTISVRVWRLDPEEASGDQQLELDVRLGEMEGGLS